MTNARNKQTYDMEEEALSGHLKETHFCSNTSFPSPEKEILPRGRLESRDSAFPVS